MGGVKIFLLDGITSSHDITSCGRRQSFIKVSPRVKRFEEPLLYCINALWQSISSSSPLLLDLISQTGIGPLIHKASSSFLRELRKTAWLMILKAIEIAGGLNRSLQASSSSPTCFDWPAEPSSIFNCMCIHSSPSTHPCYHSLSYCQMKQLSC